MFLGVHPHCDFGRARVLDDPSELRVGVEAAKLGISEEEESEEEESTDGHHRRS